MTRRAEQRYRKRMNRALRRYKSAGNLAPQRSHGDTVQSLRAHFASVQGDELAFMRQFARAWGASVHSESRP